MNHTSTSGKRNSLILFVLIFIPHIIFATDYYVRSGGNDSKTGTSISLAWKTIAKVNTINFSAGDRILFEGGTTFSGNIYFDSSDAGTSANPIVITSYGTGRALVDAGTSYGFFAYNTAGVSIQNISFSGSGSSNVKDGILFYNDLAGDIQLDYIRIDSVEVSGFNENGINIGSWNNASGYQNVTIKNALVHDNARGGISSYAQAIYGHKNFTVSYSKTYNNPGRPDITSVSSGSGIVMGGVDGMLIEHCESYNNGAQNGHLGGGPVGIWCWSSNNVIIQYNESHHNHAGLDKDGGGFDFDGGTTNSITQYNYSHDNEGAGLLFAEYTGATPMINDTIRYNISENDGRKNNYGGLEFYGGSPFSNCTVYNNTVFANGKGLVNGVPSVVYLYGSNFSNVSIYNNNFISDDNAYLINSGDGPSTSVIQFKGNNYYSANSNFQILWGANTYTSLAQWKSAATGQEMEGSNDLGMSDDPKVLNMGAGGTISDLTSLQALTAYQLTAGSPLIDAGLNLNLSPYSCFPGKQDFWGNPIPSGSGYDIGANEFDITTGIKAENKLATTSVYPTLFDDHLTISWASQNDNHLKVELFDVTGDRIFSKEVIVNRGLDQFTISEGLHTLSTGVYFAVISNAESRVTKKLVK